MTAHETVISIELTALMRNVREFLHRNSQNYRSPRSCAVQSGIENAWQRTPAVSCCGHSNATNAESSTRGSAQTLLRACSNAPKKWSGDYGESLQCLECDRPGSCTSLDGPQEGIHWNDAARDIAQALGEPKGCLFPAGEEIAQVGFRAASYFGKVSDRHASVVGPELHGM